MSKIYTSADQLIGKTPLMELTHIEKEHGLKAKILLIQVQTRRRLIQLRIGMN